MDVWRNDAEKGEYIMYVIISIIFLLITPRAFASPAISSYSGTMVSGQTVSVNGSGFGTHPLQVEFNGENIEAGANGASFSKSGWITGWGWADPIYSTDAAHSGSKSLKCTVNSSNYNCAFAYDMPNVLAGQSLYLTWWVRYSGGTGGQWKMLRLSGNQTIVDGAQELVFFNWLTSTPQIVIDPATANDQTRWIANELFPAGDANWYRMEVDLKAGSQGSGNGTLVVTRTTSTGTITSSTVATNFNTHPSSGNNYGYAIWQNYCGNGITSANIWFDDMYIQYNTKARVEICSGGTWANRGVCEIQTPTNWSASSANIKINRGSFGAAASANLYVVDSTGSANSNGYAITFGGSGGGGDPEPLVPSAPTNLSIN